MDELSLQVEGTRYSGWQDVDVQRSIEQLAFSFNVGFTERWNEMGDPLPINEGDSVIVKLDDDTVIQGYVDDSNLSYTNNSHSAVVTGRSSTGDLVDCAAIYKSGLWRNAGIAKIAEDLCSPFSVDVETVGDMGSKFRRFAIQDGETVHETLERAARMRGLMVLTSNQNKLLLARRGTRKSSTVLRRGENILAGSRRGSMRDRFSQYIGKAQIPGDDSQSGDTVTFKRTVDDDRVRRYRPTIIMAENEDTGKELKDRVKWERNRRAGDARRLNYTVQGWRDNEGKLWEPNTLVDVEDDFLRVKLELLVVSVTNRKGNDGTTTELELTRKEAFDLIEFPAPRPTKRGDDFYA